MEIPHLDVFPRVTGFKKTITSGETEELQGGWRHFTVAHYVRGCNGRPFGDCVNLWVVKTGSNLLSVAWTLADNNGTSFLGKQQLTVSNEAHLLQIGSLGASSITYTLESTDRNFVISQKISPGVKYLIELK